MDIKAKLARSLHCEERALLFIHVYVVATIKKNETRSSMTRSKNRSQAVGKHHSKLQNIGVWHDKKGEIQRIRRETKVIQYRTECPQISPPSKRQCRIAERTQIRAPGLNGQPGEPGKTPKTPQVQQKSVEANPKKKKKIAAQ